MGGASKPPTDPDESKSVIDVSRDVTEQFEKRPPSKAFGPHPHKVQWGPNSRTLYGDHNNPFYYRTPTGKKGLELPAHVPQNVMNLELHLKEPRQRVFMTEAERDWRRKWVTDQNLHPDEPFYIEEVQFYINPIRKIYRMPLDLLAQKFIYPNFGSYHGTKIRKYVPMCVFGLFGLMAGWYYVKYNRKEWNRSSRPQIMASEPWLGRRDEIEAKYPGLFDKAYHKYDPKEFYENGYSRRAALLDVGQTNRPW